MVEAAAEGGEAGGDGVAGEDERGDGTCATGNGGDGAGNSEEAVEVGVADDFVVDDVDTEVQDRCTGFDHVGGDQSGTPGSDSDEVGAPNLFGQIDRLAVANGDGGVASGEEGGEWSPDDVAATDDDGTCADEGDLEVVKELYASLRSAWVK